MLKKNFPVASGRLCFIFTARNFPHDRKITATANPVIGHVLSTPVPRTSTGFARMINPPIASSLKIQFTRVIVSLKIKYTNRPEIQVRAES